MQQFITRYASLLLANWQRALLGGLIVVSVVISLMGILKKVVFDRIPNKLVRKICLAFSSIILVFPTTALYFCGDGINFDHYWVGVALCSVAVIIVYWLYENTGCRNFIHFVGDKTINKLIKAIFAALIKDDKETKDGVVLLKEVTTSVKSDVKTELKNVSQKPTYVEDDLKNL